VSPRLVVLAGLAALGLVMVGVAQFTGRNGAKYIRSAPRSSSATG